MTKSQCLRDDMIDNRFFICGILIANICSLISMEKNPLLPSNPDVERAIVQLREKLKNISSEEIGAMEIYSQINNENISKEKDNIFCLFAHGFAGCSNDVFAYSDKVLASKSGKFSFNFPTLAVTKKNTALLGQDENACTLYRAYKKARSILDNQGIYNQKFVFFGVTEGASSIIHLLSALLPTDLNHIKAAILESPFAHTKDIEKGYTIKEQGSFLSTYIANNNEIPGKITVFTAPKFDNEPINPQDLITHFPDKPVMFVSLIKNKFIPHSSTRSLYKKIKTRNDVYHTIITNKTADPNALFAWRSYKRAVHEFYKENNLPFQKNFMDKKTKTGDHYIIKKVNLAIHYKE